MEPAKITKLFFISLAAFIALTLIISASIYAWQKNHPRQVVCTQEAMLCPDGSAVGRTGPNCEFAKCPRGPKQTIKYTGNPAYSAWTEEQIKNDCRSKGGNFKPCASSCEDPSGPCIQSCIQECTFANSGGGISAGSPSAPKDWKTYRNNKYGFEVKYPLGWVEHESLPGDSTIVALTSPNRNFCCPGPPANVTVSIRPTNLEFKDWLKGHSPDAGWQLESMQHLYTPTGEKIYLIEVPGPGDMNVAAYIKLNKGFLEIQFNDMGDNDTSPFWHSILMSFKNI